MSSLSFSKKNPHLTHPWAFSMLLTQDSIAMGLGGGQVVKQS